MTFVSENSVLLEIAAPGTLDDYREAETPGAPVWTGQARGYLKVMDRNVITQGSGSDSHSDVTLVRTTVFFIRRVEGAPALEAAGDDATGSTVLIRDLRSVPPRDRRFRVVGVEDRQAGLSTDSVRLELDDEQGS